MERDAQVAAAAWPFAYMEWDVQGALARCAWETKDASQTGVLGSLNTALIHHFFSVVLAVAVAFVFAFVGLIISGISIFFVSYFVRWFWKITYFL